VSETPQAILRYGSLEADRSRFLIKAGERQFELSATEFAIVCLLMEQPGRVFTRSQIITRTKGEDYPVTDRTIDVHITSLRKKLGDYLPVETIRGIGYRLKENG
jgi:two-component system phosphate regulon response regulator PhoB